MSIRKTIHKLLVVGLSGNSSSTFEQGLHQQKKKKEESKHDNVSLRGGTNASEISSAASTAKGDQDAAKQSDAREPNSLGMPLHLAACLLLLLIKH